MFIISPGAAFDNRKQSSDGCFLDVFVPPESRFRKMKNFQVSKPGYIIIGNRELPRKLNSVFYGYLPG